MTSTHQVHRFYRLIHSNAVFYFHSFQIQLLPQQIHISVSCLENSRGLISIIDINFIKFLSTTTCQFGKSLTVSLNRRIMLDCHRQLNSIALISTTRARFVPRFLFSLDEIMRLYREACSGSWLTISHRVVSLQTSITCSWRLLADRISLFCRTFKPSTIFGFESDGLYDVPLLSCMWLHSLIGPSPGCGRSSARYWHAIWV